MTTTSRTLLLGFAALGLAAASASSVVHYRLLTNPAYSSFCDVSATVNCTQAYMSQYGSLFGVPVAIFGVLFFLLVLLLVGPGGGEKSRVRDSVPGYVFVLSTLALAFSLYLAWASYVQLRTFCLLCAATYAAVLALFVISGGATTVPMTTLPRRAPRDLRHLLSSPAALVLALLYLVGAGSVIAYFPDEPARAQAAAPMAQLSDQQRAELVKWWELQPRVDLSAPVADAKVVLVGFSDFQCPHCRSAHESYRSLRAKYAGNTQVRFIARHFPLEGECNANAPGGNHMAACEAAAAVVMGRQTGKAAAIEDWLYEHQMTLTPSNVREAAKDVAGIADFNAGYAKALEEVREDARMGGVLGVTSTPTFFLNGRKLPAGVVPAEYIDALITAELQRAK